MIIKFPPREAGQGLVEYALILVLVAIVVIAVLLLLGPQVGRVFSQVGFALANPGGFGSQTVVIEAFSVTGTSGMGCSVSLYTLRVKVTENGQPVSGAAVQATISIQQGGSNPTVSGATNSSGVVQWTGTNLGTDLTCGGRTATATVAGGPSATASY